MRLPGTGKPDWPGPAHFLTDFYSQRFKVPLSQFINQSDYGYLKFYGQPAIQISGKCYSKSACMQSDNLRSILSPLPTLLQCRMEFRPRKVLHKILARLGQASHRRDENEV